MRTRRSLRLGRELPIFTCNFPRFDSAEALRRVPEIRRIMCAV